MSPRYDASTALLVVDVQNDFVDAKGTLYVSGAEDIVETINSQIAEARQAGALVVYSQDWHPPETPHFERYGGIWPVHCVRDTWGAEFYPALDHSSGEVLKKGTDGRDGYSAFFVRDPVSAEESPTGLNDILETHHIERIVVVGVATDYCVKESALDAIDHGLDVEVLTDAIRAVNLRPQDGDEALALIAERGGRLSARDF
jgi:nicotinamidase/pyrazinamidase